MTRRPVDPEEELRWMAQEVRGYVEAVLNSLAANVPKVKYLIVKYPLILVKINHLISYDVIGYRQLFSAKLRRQKKICSTSYTVLSGLSHFMFLLS